jgi:threonine/homoserine/homoserine lactone efflux protein
MFARMTACVSRSGAVGLNCTNSPARGGVHRITGDNHRVSAVLDHVLAVLPAFLLACVILAALPGPATALFIHRTVRDGRGAGLAAVAGNEIGLFLWLLAGGAGLSALLAANRVLFDAMHLVGAVVLVILGVQAWRSARHSAAEDAFASALTARLPGGRGAGSAFRASLVSIAANPKAAVFAISFLPQFLPRHGALLPTVLVLATIQVTLDTLYCTGVVLLADRARRYLARAAIRRRIERGLGLVLVGLGCELALDRAR